MTPATSPCVDANLPNLRQVYADQEVFVPGAIKYDFYIRPDLSATNLDVNRCITVVDTKVIDDNSSNHVVTINVPKTIRIDPVSLACDNHTDMNTPYADQTYCRDHGIGIPILVDGDPLMLRPSPDGNQVIVPGERVNQILTRIIANLSEETNETHQIAIIKTEHKITLSQQETINLRNGLPTRTSTPKPTSIPQATVEKSTNYTQNTYVTDNPVGLESIPVNPVTELKALINNQKIKTLRIYFDPEGDLYQQLKLELNKPSPDLKSISGVIKEAQKQVDHPTRTMAKISILSALGLAPPIPAETIGDITANTKTLTDVRLLPFKSLHRMIGIDPNNQDIIITDLLSKTDLADIIFNTPGNQSAASSLNDTLKRDQQTYFTGTRKDNSGFYLASPETTTAFYSYTTVDNLQQNITRLGLATNNMINVGIFSSDNTLTFTNATVLPAGTYLTYEAIWSNNNLPVVIAHTGWEENQILLVGLTGDDETSLNNALTLASGSIKFSELTIAVPIHNIASLRYYDESQVTPTPTYTTTPTATFLP